MLQCTTRSFAKDLTLPSCYVYPHAARKVQHAVSKKTVKCASKLIRLAKLWELKFWYKRSHPRSRKYPSRFLGEFKSCKRLMTMQLIGCQRTNSILQVRWICLAITKQKLNLWSCFKTELLTRLLEKWMQKLFGIWILIMTGLLLSKPYPNIGK